MGIDPEDYAMKLREMASRQGRSEEAPARKPGLSRKEREIQAAILEAARYWKGVTLWRNNVGAVKEGTRFIRFGAPGLSDLIGWVTVAEEFAWKHHPGPAVIARFVALECKREGQWPTQAQQRFLDAVREAGGLAGVVRNVEDARRLLGA